MLAERLPRQGEHGALRVEPGRSAADTGKMTSTFSGLAARVLPEGRRLPEAVWQRRHRGIMCLALVLAVGIELVSWLSGSGPATAGLVLASAGLPLILAVVNGLPARCGPEPPRSA